DQQATDGPSCGRIVNHAFDHRTTKRIDSDRAGIRRYRRTEVTTAVSRRWNRCKLVIHDACVAVFLPVEKEKRLVGAVVNARNHDRTSDVEAIIVSPAAWAGIAVGMTGTERGPGIQGFVHEIVVPNTMELIRARLHGVVENAAAGLSVLGGVIA